MWISRFVATSKWGQKLHSGKCLQLHPWVQILALDRYTMRGEKEGVCLVVGRCVCECVCVSVCSCILVSCVMCPHVCVMSVAVFRPPVSTQREKRVCEPPILPESNHGAPYLLQRQVRRWRVRVQVCTVPSCFLFPSVFPVCGGSLHLGGFSLFLCPLRRSCTRGGNGLSC